MALAGNQSLLKKINRMALVRQIAHKPGLSRIELSKQTGLTKSTVSVLVQELIETGWLIEETQFPPTGALGRRPTPLYLNTTRLMILGVDLSVEHVQVVATTLTGEVIAYDQQPLEDNRPDAAVHQLSRIIAKVLVLPILKRRTLLGIGVGVPGVVRNPEGLVTLAPNLRWRKVPLLKLLTNTFEQDDLPDVPIHIENDYNAAALGEYEFGIRPLPDPLLYLGVGVGIGAGIIVHNRLFLGAQSFAGEVGHTILNESGSACSCGRRGCAETFVGLQALTCRLSPDSDTLITIEEIKRRLSQKDVRTEKVLSEAGHYLGVLLQNLWTSFNPGKIVLGGPVCTLGDALLNATYATFDRYAKACGLPTPQIELTRYGCRAISIGAAALVRHPLLHPFEHDSYS